MKDTQRFNLGLIKYVPHRIFGYFNGKFVLDDGTEITIERMPGVAEKVENRW